MEVELCGHNESRFYYTQEHRIDRAELAINDDEYVRITCKDGSHMVLSDVKEIYVNKLKGGEV